MKKVFLGLILLATSACTSPEEAEFKQAQKAVSQELFKEALESFDRVIKRNLGSALTLEAAREAARISFYEVKDFSKAVEYYHFLVLNSKDDKERLDSQKQIAGIYFNNLQNYSRAIIEYSKLQQMPHTDLEAAQYKMNVARAQYYQNNFFQAESEIDSLLKLKGDESTRFSALLLKGNILVARKDFAKATDIFKDLIRDFPEKSIQENVVLILAVCYEESFDFKSALLVLEAQRGKYNPPEYIELRIKRLKERMKNAPGAKGFRK